jgi:hypothetical protein
MDLKRMQNLSQEYIDKFKEAATELVRNEVTNTDEENIKKIIMFTSRDMAIGSLIKRNEHIAIGIGIGVGIASLSFAISNKVLKRNIEKQIEKEIMINDINEKEGAKSAFDEVSVSQSEIIETESTSKDEETIMDRVNAILKKPSNLEDLKSVIREIKDNEKK